VYLSIITIIDAIAVTILYNKKYFLCLIKYYAKRRMGRRGTAPFGSNFDTVWRLNGQLHAMVVMLLMRKGSPITSSGVAQRVPGGLGFHIS
jgi:hypothetical protein